MLEAPFVIKSTDPINKTYAYQDSLKSARECVDDLQSRGECMVGWIACYKNNKFVIIEKINYFKADLSAILRK